MARINEILRSIVIHAAAFAAVFFASGQESAGLGPHECALIVNRNSRQSLEVANYYADLRQIPANNIITLDIPDAWLGPDSSITPDQFKAAIHDKVVQTIAERQLPHVLAWIYSVDFPSIISTAPPMSLTGITFVRGVPPAGEMIQSGKWPSPLFAGPDSADGPAGPSISLENAAIKLGTNLPIPSMMLGWSGSRGMAPDEIKAYLRSSFLGDATYPRGTIYLEKNENIRSQTRLWQFDRVKAELAGTGLDVLISSEPPAAKQPVVGVMLGRADYSALDFGRLSGGAYADSLTSFGAAFHLAQQTKTTGWLLQGAAGTSGTITEPGSLEVPVALWPKFPMARIFSHYAAGCTLLESFYLATRSPLQILPLGDPLSRPWSSPPPMSLVNLAEDASSPLSGKAEFMASLGGFAGGAAEIMYMMDGRPLMKPSKGSPVLGFQTTGMPDGYHELRAVSYSQGLVRQQGFARLSFEIQNRGRSVQLSGYTNLQHVSSRRLLQFGIRAENDPTEVRIIGRGQELARSAYSNDMELSVDLSGLGEGPVEFQAVAQYPGPELVASRPVKLLLSDVNQAPGIAAIHVETNDIDRISLRFESLDPDGDSVRNRWFVDVLDRKTTGTLEPDEKTGALSISSSNILLSARGSAVHLVYPLEQPHTLSALRTVLSFPDPALISDRHRAGILFNYVDAQNHLFWGADGGMSAWTLRRVTNGEEKTLLSRGAPIRTGVRYEVSIESLENGSVSLRVDGVEIGRQAMNFSPGRTGVSSGQASTIYEYLQVAPPGAVNASLHGAGPEISMPPGDNDLGLIAVASDGVAATIKKMNP